MSKPNFLVIQADQLTAMVLGLANTPHLDRLAQSAMVFANAYCNFPLCAPSRMAMLTGRLASSLQIYDNASSLNSEIPTYAHYLRHVGYHTCLSGKMHFVGPDQLHGFEQRLTTDIYPSDFTWTEKRSTRDDKHKSDARGVTQSGYCKRSVQIDHDELAMFHAEQKLHDLAKSTEIRPWLLHVSLTHPHDPYYCLEEHWNRYSAGNIPAPTVGRIPVAEQDPLSRFINERHALDVDFDPADIQRARRGYLGSVSYFDDQVGRLTTLLDSLGLRDDTVVIVTSDHGEMLGERGMWFKRHHFEWSSRVPLLISAPSKILPGQVDTPVSHVDLLPTLIELAGENLDAQLVEAIDGRSLLHDDPDRVVLGETMSDGLSAPVFMVRSGRFKLLAGPAYPTTLYDIESDSNELDNVAEQNPETTQRLLAIVKETWDPDSLQSDIERSIDRRLMIRESHEQGTPPVWDYLPGGEDNSRWCRSWSDYNAWAFDVLDPRQGPE